MNLESEDPDSLRSSLSPYKFPFRLHTLLTSLQKRVYSLDSLILSDQTNIPTHFSSLNLALLCKQMEMCGQEKYTITLKIKIKKEMYSLTSIVPSLSLSLSLILSAILGFSILKIIFILPMDYTMEGLSTKIMSSSLTVLQE